MSNMLMVAGTINMDLVAYLDHFPETGETIASNQYYENPGGKAANQAVAASRLGATVTFVGQVGNDDYGKSLTHYLESDNVDCRYVMSEENESTGTSFILVDPQGRNQIVTNLKANEKLTEQSIIGAALNHKEKLGAILLQLEIDVHRTERIISKLRKEKIGIILNLAPALPLSGRALYDVDVLIVNEVEASQITGYEVNGEKSAKKAIGLLRKRPDQVIVITLGSSGVVFNDENECHFYAAPVVEVVDSTAAGDCFCGAFATHWVKQKNIKEIVRESVYAASFSVTRRGAQQSLPYDWEIQSFKNKEGVDIT